MIERLFFAAVLALVLTPFALGFAVGPLLYALSAFIGAPAATAGLVNALSALVAFPAALAILKGIL